MINSKDGIVAEMADCEKILAMYKKAFPENPAFATGQKKKDIVKKAASKTEQKVETAPAVF